VGFAIPIKQITAALSDFFTPEASAGYWFGARVGTFNPPLTISEVQPGSPAAVAGLRKGQRVLTVRGKSPRSLVDFHRLILGDEKEVAVTLQVETNGQRRAINVPMITVRELVKQKFGLAVRDLTPQEAASVRARPGDAAIIEQVEKNGPAERANLQPGFLLTAVNDRKAGDLLRSVEMVAGKRGGDRMRFSFIVPRSFGARAGEYSTTLTVR
jgi:S1-C subfamily serine protease